jgi:hypothetical protein
MRARDSGTSEQGAEEVTLVDPRLAPDVGVITPKLLNEFQLLTKFNKDAGAGQKDLAIGIQQKAINSSNVF